MGDENSGNPTCLLKSCPSHEVVHGEAKTDSQQLNQWQHQIVRESLWLAVSFPKKLMVASSVTTLVLHDYPRFLELSAKPRAPHQQ